MTKNGRGVRFKKHTVQAALALDLLPIRRAGLLRSGKQSILRWHTNGRENATIRYSVEGLDGVPLLFHLEYTVTRADGSKEQVNCPVELAATPCHFGRHRDWFICPLIVGGRACRRRCRILYLPPGATYFGCRECHRLTYPCRQRHRSFVYETLGKHLNALDQNETYQPPRSPTARTRRERRIETARAGAEAGSSYIDTRNLAAVPTNSLGRMIELMGCLTRRIGG